MTDAPLSIYKTNFLLSGVCTQQLLIYLQLEQQLQSCKPNFEVHFLKAYTLCAHPCYSQWLLMLISTSYTGGV